MTHRIEVYEPGGRWPDRPHRLIEHHPHLGHWSIYFPPARSVGRRVEWLGGNNGFTTSAEAAKTLMRAYPHRKFRFKVIRLPDPAATPTVGNHGTGATSSVTIAGLQGLCPHDGTEPA